MMRRRGRFGGPNRNRILLRLKASRRIKIFAYRIAYLTRQQKTGTAVPVVAFKKLEHRNELAPSTALNVVDKRLRLQRLDLSSDRENITRCFYLRKQHFFSSKYLRSETSPCFPMLNESIGRWYPITRVQTSHFVRSLSLIPYCSRSVIFSPPICHCSAFLQ